MKRIYLIRHGQACGAEGPRRCLSRTDVPLDEAGREQAQALARWARESRPAVVYASPALRCRQTAAAISDEMRVLPELWEMSVGQWENCTFAQIRARWPREYQARGLHMGTVPPPGGESFCQAGQRLAKVLEQIGQDSRESAAVIAHAGLFRGWLWEPLGLSRDDVLEIRQPCGGITTLEKRQGRLVVTGLGLCPGLPGPAQIQSLWERCGTPQPVREHCQAVADTARRLARRCPAANRELVYAAGLLHDLYRTQGREHPRLAARLLEAEGWPLLADTVARHHDLGPAPSPEAELLYLADKLIQGTRRVAWQERFRASRERCRTPEALQAWTRRYQETARLAERYDRADGAREAARENVKAEPARQIPVPCWTAAQALPLQHLE